MSHTVLAIHGAGEPRQRDGKVYWEPLLRASLGPGYGVHAPRMPAPDDPHHRPWADRIARLIAELDRPILVGHSFGASTLLKHLGQVDSLPAFRGLFLIATPFWGADFPEFALTGAELRQLQGVSPLHFYHSRDDEVVGFNHLEKFQRALPHGIFQPLEGRGHEFDQATFPELATDILSN
jgi:hypothetical protein